MCGNTAFFSTLPIVLDLSLDSSHSTYDSGFLDAIYYVDSAGKLVKSSTVKKSRRTILSDKENEIPTDDDDSAHLQRKILEDLRKLECSENVDEEAVKQWVNENSTLECCEVLSDLVVQKKQGISKNVLKVMRKIL
ncbi:hypothetical protein AVEN_77306-1 [Araneus ventricosus]|uniref:Uncharacterized protein n=1 Tax=Araneus ventricosus TaxID=182803 RepID=A0A4Y2NTL7_ARAVE|nr:hypothetical protein AVEN_77306-1 [Araneus ventricosus]